MKFRIKWLLLPPQSTILYDFSYKFYDSTNSGRDSVRNFD